MLSGPTGWNLVHPDDRDRVARDLAAAASKGEMRTECRLRSSDGGGIWVQASAVALQAAGDAPSGFLATLTDISDVKRAAAERERLLAAEQAARLSLADQTERLNCLIENAIPGVLFTDEQGRITHVNQSFATMFGIEAPDPLVGTAASDLVRRIKGVFADPDEFVRRTAKAFSARQPVAGEQMTAADGRTLECDYWPVVVGGRYRGDLWLAWDMTERKQLEEQREQLLEAELAARRSAELGQRQLEMQNEKLRELDQAKTVFLATVSHELRTPLTSIVSFSELMRAETQALTAGWRAVPRHHRAERAPAAPSRRRSAAAEQARVGGRSAGSGAGIRPRAGRRGGPCRLGQGGEARGHRSLLSR